MVTGQLLGNRYQILELVGGGGMSLVYRARDVYLNRIVAIKILREQFTHDEEFIARFRREAQAVASLCHENIVSIFDVGQDKDTYYLIMEMVEGKNLKQVINERGPLSVKESVDIAKQICDALEHAHEHQIIHRDIKPHNIIITESGKAKVTDFGIARAVSTATVTHTGSIMGSVHYFSPEQAKGEIADEQSDIYSLGAVIYEMLTNRLPFEADTPISVALKKIHDDPIPPRHFNRELTEAIEQVILRAMNRELLLRYDTVFQLREDLLSAYLYNRLEYPVVKDISQDTMIIPQLKRRKATKKSIFSSYRFWGWVMTAFLIVGFIIGLVLSVTALVRAETHVPDVTNTTVELARTSIENANLVMEITKTLPHPTIEKGYIVEQSPKAHEIRKKKTTVEVIVSDGPLFVVVPNIIGSSLLSAEVTLNNTDLLIGEPTRAYNSQIPAGQIIHQEPLAGKEIIQGSAVNVIVSRGPEPVYIKMPSLIGISLSQAKIILRNQGLELGMASPERSNRFAKDTVIRQDPGVDSDILQGSIVNLVISEGPGNL